MRGLIRRTAVLAGAVAVLLGMGMGVAAAQSPLPSAGGSTSASTTNRCSPGAPGLGFYNGKVCIGTTPIAGGFAMKDPARPGLSCAIVKNREEAGFPAPGLRDPFTQPDNTWGNGKPADLKTACVDAMYAAGEMWDMLGAWFGRNGFDGQGHAAPIGVGWRGNKAVFLPEVRQVILGRVCPLPEDVFPLLRACRTPWAASAAAWTSSRTSSAT